jgi:hypothetical protein
MPSMCQSLASLLQHTAHVGLAHHVHLCFGAMQCRLWLSMCGLAWLAVCLSSTGMSEGFVQTSDLGCHHLHVPDALGLASESFWRVLPFVNLVSWLANWRRAAGAACIASRQGECAQAAHVCANIICLFVTPAVCAGVAYSTG